jgi:hypothetical protein
MRRLDWDTRGWAWSFFLWFEFFFAGYLVCDIYDELIFVEATLNRLVE